MKEGRENVLFREKFYEWEERKKSLTRRAKRPGGEQSPAPAVKASKDATVEDILKEYNREYSYQDLISGNYRDDIDQAKKEVRTKGLFNS